MATSSTQASPAPAPVLRFPTSGSGNVDPDPTLCWEWVDNLIPNGSFEKGLSPWSTGGSNPSIWRVYTNVTDAYGMGLCWATVVMPNQANASGKLVQDFQIPADASSAVLSWKQRVWNQIPSLVIGRLRIELHENGAAILRMDNVNGSEPLYQSHEWVNRSTNLIAYAGRSLQLVIQADSYSPVAANSWWADLDGFSFTCDHPTMPEFQVYIGTSSALAVSNCIAITPDLSFDSVVLQSCSTNFWRVDSVRDGVTNSSPTAWFTTRQRVLPELRIVSISELSFWVRFLSRLNRFYTVEQSESLGESAFWYDATRAVPGSGGEMEIEVLCPSSVAFWRLRASP